ncbi:MAG TPA: Uma2 family endonuclease [Lacipirellulaceae bacterium]|nr:Uma2 family endonuclease [Lacipirellulaceae bacterium]
MSMIAPVKSSLPLQEHVYLPGVSYSTYESLVTEIEGRRRLRITYYHGRMEIMSPLQEHERQKKLIGRMIEVVTEELGIPIMSLGQTTFKDQLLDCGLEPDECYYVQHEANVRGRTVDINQDPPPDLVVEVDITTSVIDRFPIYAALGFPEIWQYVDGNIVIHLLQTTGQYAVAEVSSALPMVSTKKLVEHLDRCHQTDETTWIRVFRQWVRDGMK